MGRQKTSQQDYERIEGSIVSEDQNQRLQDVVLEIAGDMMADGYELQDALNYLQDKVKRILEEKK